MPDDDVDPYLSEEELWAFIMRKNKSRKEVEKGVINKYVKDERIDGGEDI